MIPSTHFPASFQPLSIENNEGKIQDDVSPSPQSHNSKNFSPLTDENCIRFLNHHKPQEIKDAEGKLSFSGQ